MDAKDLVIALRGFGFTQREIGEACALSQGAISHIETGRIKSVLVENYKKLESFYRIEKKRRERAVRKILRDVEAVGGAQ
jgi:transcriptional regulator with XRE-family HTH domain